MLSRTDAWWVQTLVQRRNHHSLGCLCLWWNSCRGAGLLSALCIPLWMTSKAPSTYKQVLYTEKYRIASWRECNVMGRICICVGYLYMCETLCTFHTITIRITITHCFVLTYTCNITKVLEHSQRFNRWAAFWEHVWQVLFEYTQTAVCTHTHTHRIHTELHQSRSFENFWKRNVQ